MTWKRRYQPVTPIQTRVTPPIELRRRFLFVLWQPGLASKRDAIPYSLRYSLFQVCYNLLPDIAVHRNQAVFQIVWLHRNHCIQAENDVTMYFKTNQRSPPREPPRARSAQIYNHVWAGTEVIVHLRSPGFLSTPKSLWRLQVRSSTSKPKSNKFFFDQFQHCSKRAIAYFSEALQNNEYSMHFVISDLATNSKHCSTVVKRSCHEEGPDLAESVGRMK